MSDIIRRSVGELEGMQANFQSAVVLANLYFCEKTREALKVAFKPHAIWWELSQEDIGTILGAMQGEVLCRLRPEELLR